MCACMCVRVCVCVCVRVCVCVCVCALVSCALHSLYLMQLHTVPISIHGHSMNAVAVDSYIDSLDISLPPCVDIHEDSICLHGCSQVQ